METVIELNKISKSFGATKVLDGITLKLQRGRFYALLGKNGSGKSTLMKIIMRFERPDEGAGQILDHLLEEDTADLNLEVGYVTESINYALPLQFIHFLSIPPLSTPNGIKPFSTIFYQNFALKKAVTCVISRAAKRCKLPSLRQLQFVLRSFSSMKLQPCWTLARGPSSWPT